MKGAKFIVIEHLEPLTKFVWLEYRHISKIWNKKVIFTNVKRLNERKKLRALGKVKKESILEYLPRLEPLNGCVLDPIAEKTLVPEEAKNFDFFILGGICGDYPAKHRTYKYITSRVNLPARNLGREQLSTDTAALVLKLVLQGKKIKDLRFVKPLIIKLGEFEEVELPFSYLEMNGRTIFTPGLGEYLKRTRRI